MKTRQKKRYLTANQIRDDIDRYKKKALDLEVQATGMEQHAKRLSGTIRAVEECRWLEDQARKARRAANRIYKNRLPALKQKLAEWSTELLPGVITDGDRSIQA